MSAYLGIEYKTFKGVNHVFPKQTGPTKGKWLLCVEIKSNVEMLLLAQGKSEVCAINIC